MGNLRKQQSAANAGRRSLIYALTAQQNRGRNQVMRSPGLRIKGGATSPTVQNENTFEAAVDGTLVRKAQADMAALVGTVTNAQFGIWIFTMNAAGTLGVSALATAATLAAIVLPNVAANVAVVGAVLVNPTGTGNFVGGTTNLDDGTVVPNAVFYNGQDIPGFGTWVTLSGPDAFASVVE